MTTSSLGLIAGLLLAIAIVAGGLVGFLSAIVLGTVGYLIGGQFDGEIDLGALVGKRPRG